MNDPFNYIESKRDEHLNELKTFLSIPSISSQSEHNKDIRACAGWIEKHLRDIGMQDVRVIKTGGHPAVYGCWQGAEGMPTILVYGHYDVQPTDPAGLWTTPPFSPTIRGDNLYARGAADDKGQIFIHFKTIEALLKCRDGLPVNLKILIEGEEEIASKHLKDMLTEKEGMLHADLAIVSDTSVFNNNIPSLCYGLRGLVFFEIELTGPNRDLHSGAFGGVVHNPIQALCEIISRLHDKKGRVLIPHFYDDVLPVTNKEAERLNRLPHSDEELMESLGIKAFYGEEGYTTLERLWIRPTLEINGIWGGYTGEGEKTVIPSQAHAKLSMRLVPNQSAGKIAGLFTEYIESIKSKTVNVKVKCLSGCEPVITNIENPFIDAMIVSLEKGFDKRPVFQREGGSIPVVAMLKEVLNLESIIVGFASPNSNAHAPDEYINLSNLYGGIKTLIYFYDELKKYLER